MIIKYCSIAAFDGLQQNVFVLPTNDVFEKTASIVKTAQVSEEIAQAVDEIQHEPGHRYLLVNALGAYEFWGPNKNTDAFPETGLKFGGEDYGYRTFMSANNFVFHDNKDPLKKVGTVKCAHYNDRMHRAELLIDTDLKKLAARTPEIAGRVERGEPVDLSMGCKCDYDICTGCGNKAANRSEYCDCLKKHGGQIMADGRRVVAYTPHPKFFDISYVEKGADVTAKSLQYIEKAAADISGSGDTHHPTLPSRTMACPDPAMHEPVSCGPEYDIPEFPQEHLAAVRRLEVAESEIDPGCLRKMASFGLPKALSTASHFGVILSPEEYQYLALSALGQEKLAEDLRAKNAVIDPWAVGTWFDPSLKTVPSQTAGENFDAKVATLLADVIPGRTIYEPFFSSRLAKVSGVAGVSYDKIASQSPATKEAAAFMTPELAAALALGYLIYRKGMPAANTDIIQKAIHDPSMTKKVLAVLIPLIATGSAVDKMLSANPPTGEKAAGIATEVVLPVAGTYLYSAYARQKAQEGRPVSGIQHMFIDYPLPLALSGVLGIKALKHRMGRTMAKSSGKISDVMEKQAMDTGMVLALGSGIYRPRLHGAIGYLVDLMIGTAAAKGVIAAKRALTGESVQSA